MQNFFNYCFDHSVTPNAWHKALIVPIFKGRGKGKKKRDPRSPKSYRPVSIISNPCKIFMNILNNRLLEFLELNNMLPEEQNGFRKNRGCTEHIFVLQSVVQLKIDKKENVYCCFIDFSSAFDFVNRDLMVHALADIGINGKFLELIRSLYKNTECAIKLNGALTPWFKTTAGVRQGQNDSPTIFSVFLTSLANEIKNKSQGVRFGDHNVAILLYADDIAILAETENELQEMLDIVKDWCAKWRMQVSMDKTQVVHFRHRRAQPTEYTFNFNGEALERVSSYKYLGCTIDEFLRSEITGNELAEGACRALGKVLSKFYQNKGLGYKTFTKLYETCVMDYSSGVWGFSSIDSLDRIHERAMRCYLGVNKYAAKCGIEGDVGWVPPQIRRKIEILRFWNRIVRMPDDRLPRQVYNHLLSVNKGWVNQVSEIFSRINCSDVFDRNVEIVNFVEFKSYALNQLMSQHHSSWLRMVQYKSKLYLYTTFKEEFGTENYCSLNLNRTQRSLIAKLRLGILPINIETGRHAGLAREERYCPLCKNNEVESETHVILHCPFYAVPRSSMLEHANSINEMFKDLSNSNKIGFLTSNINMIRKTARFVSTMLSIRETILRE